MNMRNIVASAVLSVSALTAVAAPAEGEFPVKKDWSWVQGCVFVPTNCVNEAQQWDEYDPAVNDRELRLAGMYGINTVRVYLHYYVYLKNKDRLLQNVEDFLTRADKYKIKTEIVFFDDCWHEPSPDILKSDYKYPTPIYGVHNSRWLLSPGREVLKQYDEHRGRLKAYVQDVVNAHKADPRVIFWETYNEPKKNAEVERLLKDSLEWVHETGTTIPVTATGLPKFVGDPHSDFRTWHMYESYAQPGDKYTLNTECMNRLTQTVPGVIEHYKGKVGFIMWEFGIGRDNCRFGWKDKPETPAKTEPAAPFHGLVYPDGHPWSIDDMKAVMGEEAFDKLPVFTAEYFKDESFKDLAKTSVTPFIDFDLPDEAGTGSPDASAGVPHQHYSVRYSGKIASKTVGRHTLHADADGALRVTVDGKAIISKSDPNRAKQSAEFDLAAGQPAEIVIEYAHPTGPSSLHVTWSAAGRPADVLTPAGK